MAKNAESGSQALWEYVQKNSLDEFKGVKLILAMHLHDGSLLHFPSKAVKTLEDLKGLKVRAPTRIGAKLLTALGATPVQMPLPQVPESMSKGVIDGAMVPWEGVPRDQAAGNREVPHSTRRPAQPRMSNTIFVVRDEPGQVRQPAARPEEGDRRQQRPRLVEADRQGVRRHDRAREEARGAPRAACSTRSRRPSTTAG